MATNLCKIDKCNNPSRARGWCQHHYDMWVYYKDPTFHSNKTTRGYPLNWLRGQIFIQILFPDKQCVVNWPFSMSNDGYPLVRYMKQTRHACKAIILLAGIYPNDINDEVLHSCDQHVCLNIGHLRWGSHAENMKEAGERNRLPYGQNHHRTKLADIQVLDIIDSTESISSLAEKHNVAYSTIRAIKTGRTWKHLRR